MSIRTFFQIHDELIVAYSGSGKIASDAAILANFQAENICFCETQGGTRHTFRKPSHLILLGHEINGAFSPVNISKTKRRKKGAKLAP